MWAGSGCNAAVTDDQVLELAAAEGCRLVDKIAEHTATGCIGWRRGDDDRWPGFLERRLAVSWMADRLRRSGVFV